MGRNWSPKYKVCCNKCGWKGKRTLSTMHYKCPKCKSPGYNIEIKK